MSNKPPEPEIKEASSADFLALAESNKELGAEVAHAVDQINMHTPIHLKDAVNPHLETLRLVAAKLAPKV